MSRHTLERINSILQYINGNLDGDLSLSHVADVACYSPFHLHRLFRAVTGEALNAYVTRVRIERIAQALITGKELSMAGLAVQYGFGSNAAMTRAFTRFYGVSPTKFRKALPGKYSKICKTDSKKGQDAVLFEQYLCNISNYLTYIGMNAKIEIRELPATTLAYVTQIGVSGLEGAFEKIVTWAKHQGLFRAAAIELRRVYHDSFRVTDPEKVRMSIGVPVPEGTRSAGEVAIMTMRAGRHIVARFEIEPRDFGKSWEGLFVWMNEEGYRKADHDPFEIIHNNFNDHPEKKVIADLCVPVLQAP